MEDTAGQAGVIEAADFTQRLLQIVNEGSLTSTYKLALLLSLIDGCVWSDRGNAEHSIQVSELASKIVDI